MSYKQVRSPRTWVQDWAGACLRFVQSVLGIGSRGAVDFSAWSSWRNQTGRHTRNMPTNVAVVVWFSHWGTYGNPARWDNWGHVVVWVPGRGYLSSPGSGYGQAWFPTIAAVERYFGAKYVGWTTHLHGVPVIKWVAQNVKPKPAPKPHPTSPTPALAGKGSTKMFMIALRDGRKKGEHLFAVVGPDFWLEFAGQDAANNFNRQLTGGGGNPALFVTRAFWNHCKRAAGK